MENIDIYTDGGSRGNPGIGAWGAAFFEGDVLTETLSGGEQLTTNNRMELTAAIEGLRAVKDDRGIHLYTDSTYVRDGITKWIIGWKRNGWRTANKKPVKNQDLWQALDVLASAKQVEWHWVKGHAGERGNEKADELCNEYMDKLESKYS